LKGEILTIGYEFIFLWKYGVKTKDYNAHHSLSTLKNNKIVCWALSCNYVEINATFNSLFYLMFATFKTPKGKKLKNKHT
jgi:hypothetical protein